ncbi:MAG: response regulator transcription factor [Ignavibacteriales bacterium]
MGKKILVVDDEPKIVDVLADFLISEGYKVITAATGPEAAALAASADPDLILLDVMLPDQNGFEVCRLIRKDSNVPIIMLTAKSEEIDKLMGLEFGADDYITKPFSLREVAARIRAVLRRTEQAPSPTGSLLQVGPLTLDVSRYEAWVDGNLLVLTATEYKILHFLAVNAGQVLSRLQILETVFGDAYEGYERSIDTHISNIRKKIDPDPAKSSFIRTVYGVGYKLADVKETT